jgi:NADPH:quinone reductase-like Zn-dependent oxidoreductase
MVKKDMGQSPSALFGYSHMSGGIPGGQAQYLRVPFADVGPITIPDELSDEQVLFLSDVFRTGHMGTENAADRAWRYGCGMGLWPGRIVRHKRAHGCSEPGESLPLTVYPNDWR